MIVGTFRELNRRGAGPSMHDFIGEEHPEKRAVLTFLKHGGESIAAGTGVNKDVFTGEVFGLEEGIRQDGDFIWSDILAYYVDKYNLRLPDEFVAKAVAKYGAGTPAAGEVVSRAEAE